VAASIVVASTQRIRAKDAKVLMAHPPEQQRDSSSARVYHERKHAAAIGHEQGVIGTSVVSATTRIDQGLAVARARIIASTVFCSTVELLPASHTASRPAMTKGARRIASASRSASAARAMPTIGERAVRTGPGRARPWWNHVTW